jgi:chromosome segregation ATPase
MLVAAPAPWWQPRPKVATRSYTRTVLRRSSVERRLSDVGARLRSVRDELRVVEEQLRQLADEADDFEIRSLVSETPLADREHRDARRHADAMAKHRTALVQEISTLEARQDDLLDELNRRP